MEKKIFQEPVVIVVELDSCERITASECEHPHEGAAEKCSGY